MASIPKAAASCEVAEDEFEEFEEEFEDFEEEFEDIEEEEMKEDIEGEYYVEEIEDEIYEEMDEIEPDMEADNEIKAVEVQKVHEVEQSGKDAAREEEKSENLEQPPSASFPHLLQSMSDLEKIHCALSKFLSQWNSINRSLHSITAAIDAQTPAQQDALTPEQEKDERSEQHKLEDGPEHQSLEDWRCEQQKLEDGRCEQQKLEDGCCEQQKVEDGRCEQQKLQDGRCKQQKAERSVLKKKDERSLVETLCDGMRGKNLRKYIENSISDLTWLRYVVPEALRLAPNPAKLVFESIGKFYRQGSKAYDKCASLVSIRRAGILLLEFFVLSGLPTVDSSVKEQAKNESLLWWKRLVNEGLELASAVDSLGLILFLSCFGIPKEFCLKDLGYLLLKSNLNKNIDVYRRSSVLVEKIPGAIEDLIRYKMYVEAAELSCCFELNDTFPPLPLLSSAVEKIIENGTQERLAAHGSLISLNLANIKELTSLKSIANFLVDHELRTDMLGSIKIHKKITKLEKCIARIERNLNRNGENLNARKKLKTQSKKSFPLPPRKASLSEPSQMIQDKLEQRFSAEPQLPDFKAKSSVLSAAVSNANDQPFVLDTTLYENSMAGYGHFGMDYFAAQQFSQPQAAQQFSRPQASAYGNGGGLPGRNLYQFADTVIQLESQNRLPSRKQL